MKTILVLFAALVILSLAILPSCKPKVSDEEQIKAAVVEMAKAAEAKDVSAVKGHISKNYKDPAGNDYNAMKGILAYYFMQPEGISVFLREQKVELRGEKGYDTVRAVISRGGKVDSAVSVLPSEAGGFILDLTFEKEDGDWMLTSAIWREVGVGEAL